MGRWVERLDVESDEESRLLWWWKKPLLWGEINGKEVLKVARAWRKTLHTKGKE